MPVVIGYRGKMYTVTQDHADRIRGLSYLPNRTAEEEKRLQELLDGAKPVKESFRVVRSRCFGLSVAEKPEIRKGSFCDRHGLKLGCRVKVKYRELELLGTNARFQTCPGVVVSVNAKGRWVGIVLIDKKFRGRWISFDSTTVDNRWDEARLVEVDGRKVMPEKRRLRRVPLR